MDFRGDQNCGSAQARGSAAVGHPVALHALDELAGCVGDLAGFVGEVKHTAVTGDEEGGLDQG